MRIAKSSCLYPSFAGYTIPYIFFLASDVAAKRVKSYIHLNICTSECCKRGKGKVR